MYVCVCVFALPSIESDRSWRIYDFLKKSERTTPSLSASIQLIYVWLWPFRLLPPPSKSHEYRSQQSVTIFLTCLGLKKCNKNNTKTDCFRWIEWLGSLHSQPLLRLLIFSFFLSILFFGFSYSIPQLFFFWFISRIKTNTYTIARYLGIEIKRFSHKSRAIRILMADGRTSNGWRRMWI